MKKLKERLLIGLTAKKGKGWKRKLEDINRHNIKRIALFIEEIEKNKRNELYNALLKSKIREIPIVHIRGDTEKKELIFLKKNFKSEYFTIHEEHFKNMDKWAGFYKKLYLELNQDNFVSKKVQVQRIGGFCVDLSHFKVAEEKWFKEFEYIMNKKKSESFKCNHLNGYSPKKNSEVHFIKSLKDFDYIKTPPKFLFGNFIALEVYNPISEQLKFKKYLIKLFQ